MGNWRKLALALAMFGATTSASAQQRDSLVWPRVERFDGEADFQAYLHEVMRAQRAARHHVGKKQDEQVVCPPELYPCDEEEDNIVVTGSRLAASQSSITNVQNVGVDEGDIVKLCGRFLIVLQDGRLFSVDTGRAASELRLVDRANVYRSPEEDAWYDEILISDNRVVVTGYNYGENATEYSVFSISSSGKFTREGAYFISSNDYYDIENYATRLVDGSLVIYTPLDVAEATHGERARWPVVRRWLRQGEHEARTTRGRRLFDARDIYRPVQYTLEPTVHTLSVCPLGSPRAGDELECRSTAITGPRAREFYVSTSDIYLWLWRPQEYWDNAAQTAECVQRENDSFNVAAASAIYRMPLAGGPPRVMFVRGAPYDQLSMDATASAFRALSVWVDPQCERDYEDLPLRLFSTPLSAFARAPTSATASAFAPMPSPGGRAMENRFVDTYVVYGGRPDWSSHPPEEGEPALSARVVAAPISDPANARVLTAPHSALRIERIGPNAVATGYRDHRGLSVSVIALGATPQISFTTVLAGRYESEGRSHAFNSAVSANGAGLMGLPTVARQTQSRRWWWNSDSSDVSFLTVDAHGGTQSIGALFANREALDDDYSCEVSCIDWYGNSRPIFLGGRVFALSGVELIEGKIDAGAIHEIARVNLTNSQRQRSSGS